MTKIKALKFLKMTMDCKTSRSRTSATSMRYVISHPKKYDAHPTVKFADTNVGGGEGFVTYPLYALGFLKNHNEIPFIVPDTDLKALEDALKNKGSSDGQPEKK